MTRCQGAQAAAPKNGEALESMAPGCREAREQLGQDGKAADLVG
ncbi:hypothetical protein AB0E81_19255 [Streptomyces sp. NPDC033538]